MKSVYLQGHQTGAIAQMSTMLRDAPGGAVRPVRAVAVIGLIAQMATLPKGQHGEILSQPAMGPLETAARAGLARGALRSGARAIQSPATPKGPISAAATLLWSKRK